ncbi:MAG: ParA family protein [Erysipelotrichaceae bacterium]|nr:ParA family protein [Erysipelotrichaceae bacterium]
MKTKETICLAVFNRKGGTSKTTTSLSLVWTYAQKGYKTLLIDMDSQGSSSNILGINRNFENVPEISMKNINKISKELRQERFEQEDEEEYIVDDLFGNPRDIELVSSENTGCYDLLECVINGVPLDEATIKKAIITPKYKVNLPQSSKKSELTLMDLADPEGEEIEFGFSLLASSEELADIEMYMLANNDVKDKAYILKKVIDTIKALRLYDIIVLDVGPSLGFLSLNAIAASDGSIICSTLDQQSIFSICKAKKNFRDIKRLDPNQTGILGVLLTIDDPRAVIRPIILDRIKNTLNLYLFKNTVPRSSNAPKAMTVGLTFPQIDGKARVAYDNIADEILERYKVVKDWEKHRGKIVEKRIKDIKNDEFLMEIIDKETDKRTDEYLKEAGRTRDDIDEEVLDKIRSSFEKDVIMERVREEYDQGTLCDYMTNRYKGENE